MSFTSGATGGKYYLQQTKNQSPFKTSGDEAQGYGLAPSGTFANRPAIFKETSEVEKMDIRTPYYVIYRWRRVA